MLLKSLFSTPLISVILLFHLTFSGKVLAQTFTQEAEGYNVFVSGNFVFGGGDVEGAVAVGNNLRLTNNIGQFCLQEAGSYTIGGGSAPSGLLVGNRVVLNSGGLRLLSGSNISIGSNSGTQAISLENGNPSNTRIVNSGGNYSSTPNISLDHVQSETIYQSCPIDIDAAFDTFKSRSGRVAALSSNLTISNANGITINPSSIPNNSQVYINNLGDGENILNLTGANLNKVVSITFNEQPSAAKYVIININKPGTYNWNNFNFTGVGSTEAQYILLNFSNSTTVNINNARTVYATIFAPFAAIKKNNSNNIDGQVIGKSFTMTQGGEVHRMYFLPDDPTYAAIFPVEWLDLGVVEEEGNALLEWSTALELGSSHFEIERSTDLDVFESIGRVEAAGNSDQIQLYEFRDAEISSMSAESLYYRLKQVDLNGKFSFSSVMELGLGIISPIELKYSPNPVEDRLKLSWSGTENVFQISLKNLLGQVVIKQRPKNREQEMTFDLSQLESGLYFLQFESPEGLISRCIQIK